MPFVLDASVAASWAFQDEDHPAADLAFEHFRSDEAVAPSLLWFELRNILVVSERRRRLGQADTTAFLREFSRLPLRVDRSTDELEVLRLARSYQLSVYDAAYLELALREGLPLATRDTTLAKAAHAEGVRLIGVT